MNNLEKFEFLYSLCFNKSEDYDLVKSSKLKHLSTDKDVSLSSLKYMLFVLLQLSCICFATHGVLGFWGFGVLGFF